MVFQSKMRNIVVLLGLLLFINCKKESEFLGQEVFYEVFPSVFDSIYIDRNLVLPLPPYRNREEKIEYDKYTNEIEKYKTDTSQRYVLIDLNRCHFPIYNEKKIRKFLHLKKEDTIFNKNEETISIDRLKNNKKIVFKNYKEVSKEKYLIWENEISKYIVGAVSFSNIIFDKNHKRGYFQCSYSAGVRASQGFNVYIVKEKNKWKVYKIEVAWIS